MLSVMPWFHVYGITTLLSALLCGSKIISIPMNDQQDLFLNTIVVIFQLKEMINFIFINISIYL